MIGQGVFLCFLNQSHAFFTVDLQFHQEVFGNGGLSGLVKLFGYKLYGLRFAIAIDDAWQGAGVAELFAADSLGQHTRISRQ